MKEPYRFRLQFQAACFIVIALGLSFFISVLNSGCGPGFGASESSPTASSTATSSSTATATPGPLSGDVLIVGGFNNVGSPIAVSEVFSNSTTAKFAASGALKQARGYHTATLLQNQQVLVTGGMTAPSGGTVLDTAELYSASTQKWTSTKGSMIDARAFHTATLLNNGQVLISGGIDASGAPQNTAELYDPKTGKFTATGNMAFARAGHTATLLGDGSVLVVGGYSNATQTQIVQAAEVYNPSSGTWSTVGDLSTPRFYQAAVLLTSGAVNGQALIAGGYNATSVTATAELYNSANNAFAAAGLMTTSRANFTATVLSNGLVLMAGGITAIGTVTNTAELYNPGTTFGQTGNMSVARQLHTATLLTKGALNGQVLIAGGQFGTTASTALNTAELYNPAFNGFTPVSGMSFFRFAHTATRFP